MDGSTERGRIDLKPGALLEPRPPTLAIRFGRGRTGGSTMLDLLIQLARAADRDVLIGDGDRRNPTLAGLYPPGTEGGASQPASDEVPDVKDWITGLLGEALSLEQSLVLDLGGGDRVIQEYGRDLALVEFCDHSGMQPLGLFFAGPEVDDFEHVLAIWRAGYFRPSRSLLILNEHLVPQGRTTVGAFDTVLRRPEIKQLGAEGVRPVLLPRLPCMAQVRDTGLGFLDAANNMPGKSGRPLDPARQFMVRSWISKILTEFDGVGALGWLP